MQNFDDIDIENNEPSPQEHVPAFESKFGLESENQTINEEITAAKEEAGQSFSSLNKQSAKAVAPIVNQTTIGTPDDIVKVEEDNGLVTVQPVKFANFENDEFIVGTPRKNIDIMQDVNIKTTVELGRTKMKVRKILDMTKGTIIEINKVAGEQVELYVCGKLVACGEVIVIEDKFGLRVTSIAETRNV